MRGFPVGRAFGNGADRTRDGRDPISLKLQHHTGNHVATTGDDRDGRFAKEALFGVAMDMAGKVDAVSVGRALGPPTQAPELASLAADHELPGRMLRGCAVEGLEQDVESLARHDAPHRQDHRSLGFGVPGVDSVDSAPHHVDLLGFRAAGHSSLGAPGRRRDDSVEAWEDGSRPAGGFLRAPGVGRGEDTRISSQSLQLQEGQYQASVGIRRVEVDDIGP